MYSVTFTNHDGVETLSRYFETVKAARTWVKWLGKQRFTSLYRGQPGEELLDRNELLDKPLDLEAQEHGACRHDCHCENCRPELFS